MKKSAIALAVAAALAASAAAQAETTFYGRAALAVTYTDSQKEGRDVNSPDDVINFFDDGVWDIRNAGTRWGVRGSEDLGNGLSAIYHIETNLDADSHNGNGDSQTGRLAWVGLKGGFGAVKIGAQWTPYYNALGATDIFNEANWFDKYQGPFRQNSALLYETPGSISAFKGEVMLVMDGGDSGIDPTSLENPHGKEQGIDIYDIGASGNFGPVYVGAAYRNNEVADSDQWGITGSFDFAGASIAALYENWDFGGGDEGDTYYVTGQYTIGNNVLKAGWGSAHPDNGDDVDEWGLGVQHNLSNRTRVWVEYTDDDVGDESLLSIGLRHDF
ncbi:MAG: porin [Gammaproteobacteria bacterium]